MTGAEVGNKFEQDVGMMCDDVEVHRIEKGGKLVTAMDQESIETVKNPEKGREAEIAKIKCLSETQVRHGPNAFLRYQPSCLLETLDP